MARYRRYVCWVEINMHETHQLREGQIGKSIVIYSILKEKSQDRNIWSIWQENMEYKNHIDFFHDRDVTSGTKGYIVTWFLNLETIITVLFLKI